MGKRNILIYIAACFLMCLSCTQKTDYTLTANRFGPIRLGKAISQLPESMKGVYDRMEPIEREFEGCIDYNHALFEGDKQVAELVENHLGEVVYIVVLSDKYRTASGFGISSTIEELFAAGAKELILNDGFDGLLLEGMLFDGMELSESGWKKAEECYLKGIDIPFDLSDFVPGTHPERITLGKYYQQFD